MRDIGVRLPHSAVMNRLQWQWETFPFSSTERICAFKTATTFVDSLSEIWGPLLASECAAIFKLRICFVYSLKHFNIEFFQEKPF